MNIMNWDWDKLQEKRQRQNWRRDPDNQRDQKDQGGDGDNGGGNGNKGNNFSNPFKNVNVRIPQGSGNAKYIALGALVLWLLSGIYIVNPEEEGVVLRFGKHIDTVQSGPHYHLPFPIESVERPNVTEVRRVEIGFQSASNNTTYRQGQRGIPDEAAMLTGDENIVNIQFSVQYQIKNSVDYLFNVTDQRAVVKNAAEAVMREVIGNSLIDSALADGKLRIQTDAATLLQDLLDHYKIGVRILGVQMQDVHPPKEVSDAFKDVASAREDKSRLVNEAEADRNEMLPKARGFAAQKVNEASAYKETRILNAQGETQRFISVVSEYNRAKDITRQRLYLEAVEEILSRPGMEKLILSSGGGGVLPLLSLDKMLSPGGSAGTPAPNAGGK